MKTIGDVMRFYETPVRGVMTYERLVREQSKEQLPDNLHVVPETIRYDPNSEFLSGIDAFPGNPDLYVEAGVREKIKYPPMKQVVPWPDV